MFIEEVPSVVIMPALSCCTGTLVLPCRRPTKTINCQLLLRSCHIVALFIAHRVIQSFTSEYCYSTRTRIACTVLLMVMYRWSLPVDMIANQHRRIIRVSITAYRHSGIPFNPISYKTPDRPRIKIIQMVVTH